MSDAPDPTPADPGPEADQPAAPAKVPRALPPPAGSTPTPTPPSPRATTPAPPGTPGRPAGSRPAATGPVRPAGTASGGRPQPRRADPPAARGEDPDEEPAPPARPRRPDPVAIPSPTPARGRPDLSLVVQGVLVLLAAVMCGLLVALYARLPDPASVPAGVTANPALSAPGGAATPPQPDPAVQAIADALTKAVAHLAKSDPDLALKVQQVREAVAGLNGKPSDLTLKLDPTALAQLTKALDALAKLADKTVTIQPPSVTVDDAKMKAVVDAAYKMVTADLQKTSLNNSDTPLGHALKELWKDVLVREARSLEPQLKALHNTLTAVQQRLDKLEQASNFDARPRAVLVVPVVSRVKGVNQTTFAATQGLFEQVRPAKAHRLGLAAVRGQGVTAENAVPVGQLPNFSTAFGPPEDRQDTGEDPQGAALVKDLEARFSPAPGPAPDPAAERRVVLVVGPLCVCPKPDDPGWQKAPFKVDVLVNAVGAGGPEVAKRVDEWRALAERNGGTAARADTADELFVRLCQLANPVPRPPAPPAAGGKS